MQIIHESDEFKSILADNSFPKLKQFLIDNCGFEEAWMYSDRFFCYTNRAKVRFDIYLDTKKLNRVITLRAEELNKKTLSRTHALVGKFVSGKAPHPAFSFSSPEALVRKLENWKL